MTPWIDLQERLLSPDGMAERLLNSTRVVANERIKIVEGEETPELVISEVSISSTPSLFILLFIFLASIPTCTPHHHLPLSQIPVRTSSFTDIKFARSYSR